MNHRVFIPMLAIIRLFKILAQFFYTPQVVETIKESVPMSDETKTEPAPKPIDPKAKHSSNGNCPKCQLIMNKYQGLHELLRNWFENLQKQYPEAHVSDAGRGKADQERYVQSGASLATYGKSAHNYCAAIDIFKLDNGQAVWPKDWFKQVVEANLIDEISWYGAPGAAFYELPHVQIKDWKKMVADGQLELTEK